MTAGTSEATPASLAPFDGDHAAVRLAAGRQQRPLKTFGYDQSGAKTYAFSSLGYRGEELDPRARRRVFVCGASVAFGSGLDDAETWPVLFKAAYAREHGLAPAEVNLLNFSAPLAPPDYVVRTLLVQAGRLRPDLMVAEFSMFRRIEVVRGDGFASLTVPVAFRLHVSRRGPLHRPPVTRVDAHDHFLAFLRRALLLQFFCQARSIDFLLLWDRRPHEPYTALFEAPAFRPLLELLDRRSFCDFSVFDPEVFVDRSADDIHPGPRSSRIIAERLAQRYRGLRGAGPAGPASER